MRKIFIIQCGNNEVYNNFIKDVTKGVINVMSMSYYENILNPVRRALNIKDDSNKISELHDIENYWFHRNRRQSLISLILSDIEDRDGDRTVLFIHLNNKIIANRIKKHFPKVCKTLILNDVSKPENIINKKIEMLSKSDILIEFPSNDNIIRKKLINNFRMTHVPIKYLVE